MECVNFFLEILFVSVLFYLLFFFINVNFAMVGWGNECFPCSFKDVSAITVNFHSIFESQNSESLFKVYVILVSVCLFFVGFFFHMLCMSFDLIKLGYLVEQWKY